MEKGLSASSMSALTAPSWDLDAASFADEAFACPRPLRLVVDPDALSPELALVSPELAAAARTRLPERPWEAVLGTPSPLVAPPVTGEGLRLASPAPVRESAQSPDVPAAVEEPAPLAAPDPVPPRRPRRARRALELAFVVALFVGVAHLGAWESGGEELLPAAADPGEAVLYPGTVYIGSPSGTLATDASGTTITELVLPLTCASGAPVVKDLGVRELLFGFSGPLAAGGVTVQVSGEVIDREHVRGTAAAQGPGCPAGEILFSAQVS